MSTSDDKPMDNFPESLQEFFDFDGDETSYDDLGLKTVTLVDDETGEEFEFFIAYDFPFEDKLYYVLVSLDEGEPEALFARMEEDEDGFDYFITVTDDEFERVAAEYERLCDRGPLFLESANKGIGAK